MKTFLFGLENDVHPDLSKFARCLFVTLNPVEAGIVFCPEISTSDKLHTVRDCRPTGLDCAKYKIAREITPDREL